MTFVHTVCLTFTSSLSAACFYFEKPFSALYYIAFNLWGCFVFVSKNILLQILIVLTRFVCNFYSFKKVIYAGVSFLSCCRSISVSVDLECPERIRTEKSMTHSYNLRSCQERYRTVSECVGPGSNLGLASQGGRLHTKYKFPFQKLPNDCKLKIFSFLSQTDRGIAALVCQDWNNLVQNSSLWSMVDFTVFPRCHKSHNECTKLCYVMYRDRIKKFMLYLETVRPVLKRLRLAFDIGDHEDGWLENVENLLRSSRLHDLEYLYFNWTETPCKPYWEAANLTWSTGDAKGLLHKHRYRQRLFANMFDRITASAVNIQQLIIPFEWSGKSLHALSRLVRLDSLVLEKYFVYQSLSQDSLDSLFTSVPRLRNLILEVWTPSGRGLQFYTIRSAALQTLDISQCRGFYLKEVQLPVVEVFKVTRHPWNGPLTSAESVNIPCLYQVLSDGCPCLKQINEHMLRPEWRSVIYPELEVVFKNVCSCRVHKSGWAM